MPRTTDPIERLVGIRIYTNTAEGTPTPKTPTRAPPPTTNNTQAPAAAPRALEESTWRARPAHYYCRITAAPHRTGGRTATAPEERTVLISATLVHVRVAPSKHSTVLSALFFSSRPPTTYILPAASSTPQLYRAVSMAGSSVHTPVAGSKDSTELSLLYRLSTPPTAKSLPFMTATPQQYREVLMLATLSHVSVSQSYRSTVSR
mmetsp:Transcript_30951/g.72362  ORF Transcript_30951/g.72362 Transcript_30951/m.72362 type:complete len:205 (-) Transcript_30951:1497-2111(-)